VPVSTDPHIGAEFLGYRIEALAGRGGMGVVYRAYDLRLKRVVAIKFIAPELSGGAPFRERFLTETELAASLEHPNVVPIHDAGDVDGRLDEERGPGEEAARVALAGGELGVASEQEERRSRRVRDPGGELDRGPVVVGAGERDEDRQAGLHRLLRSRDHDAHVTGSGREHRRRDISKLPVGEDAAREVQQQEVCVLLARQALSSGPGSLEVKTTARAAIPASKSESARP
jgi:hypothetical protein